MGMKEAFEAFFEEMDRNSLKKTGKLPRVPYKEGLVSKDLIQLETLEKGYAVWRPQLQKEKVSFEEIEKELGFTIHSQIKKYLNTYWFRKIEARVPNSAGRVIVGLDGILPGMDFANRISYCFDVEEFCPDCSGIGEYFLIGTFCKFDDFDGLLVLVNNNTSEVIAVDGSIKNSVKLADSIEDLLYNMKGIWSIDE